MHLTIDNSYMMVTGQRQELDNLEILYTIRRKDAFFMQTKWNRGARAPVVLLKGGLLPTGLLPEVISKFNPTLDDKRVDPGKLALPRIEGAPQLYDFQEETVNTALQAGRAIIDSPTNTGKTLMAGEIIRRIGRDTLYLISSPSALLQLRDKLQRILPIPVGILGGGYKEDGVVVISTFSSAGKLNLRQYKCIIVDECHHAPAETYNEIITSCTDAYYRFGLTGTTEGRSDGLEKLMEAALSTVKIKVTKQDAREAGLRPEIRVGLFDIQMPYNARGDEAYDDYIVRNEHLNQFVVNLALRYREQNKGVVVYIDKLEHGSILSGMIPGSRFIYGKASTEERTNAMTDMHGKIVIGNKVIAESLDAPELDVIINASGNKSPIVLSQLLGRSLRGDRTKVVYVFDFMHRDGATLERRSRKRAAIWKKEADSFVMVDKDFNAQGEK